MKFTTPLTCLWFAVALLGHAEEKVFFLPQGEDVFFRKFTFESSEYLHFKVDGRYSYIDREHFGAKEEDKGVWRQDKDGVVTLESDQHFRNIEAGPLSIWTWHGHIASNLFLISNSIATHIANTKKTSFKKKDVEKWKVRFPASGETAIECPISVDLDAREVKKSQLQDLLRQLEVFDHSKDKNHFHIVPMTYSNHPFLLWKDHETSVNRDLAGIKWFLDRATNGAPPRYVYTAIDRETFEKEAHLPKEFIFYPQLNDCLRGLRDTN